MIRFFQNANGRVFAVQYSDPITNDNLEKLNWLFGDPEKTYEVLSGKYIGPRKEMITPWSTNAVEIISFR
ncbi:MAG: hypothetical protein OEW75_17065, partial [Cyclobacteriaceae bacterium]|nr:hypothetical protein [Cyclobacteriaceae bacterium]